MCNLLVYILSLRNIVIHSVRHPKFDALSRLVLSGCPHGILVLIIRLIMVWCTMVERPKQFKPDGLKALKTTGTRLGNDTAYRNLHLCASVPCVAHPYCMLTHLPDDWLKSTGRLSFYLCSLFIKATGVSCFRRIQQKSGVDFLVCKPTVYRAIHVLWENNRITLY